MFPVMLYHMLDRIGPRFGLDTSDVAEVQPARGVEMWLIPGTSGFCGMEFDHGGGSGSCRPIHPGLGPGTTGSGPQGTVAEGFAPNGVTAVIVSLSNGRKLTVPVRDNAYYAQVRTAEITGVRESPS